MATSIALRKSTLPKEKETGEKHHRNGNLGAQFDSFGNFDRI
jgi:hypothetical protein